MEMWYIFLGLVILVWIVFTMKYNSIIQLKNNRDNAFADIDVYLKLRFDLIPNLVNTVSWYAKHEQNTLMMVTQARTQYLSAGNVEDKIASNDMLTWALSKLFALSESYPDLKANQNFLSFQVELSDIENKLAASRRFFNSSTKEFNAYIEMFPNNIIANMFGFKAGLYFEVSNREELQDAPKVQF